MSLGWVGPGFDFFSRGGSSLNWGFGLWIALSTRLHTDSMVPRYVFNIVSSLTIWIESWVLN